MWSFWFRRFTQFAMIWVFWRTWGSTCSCLFCFMGFFSVFESKSKIHLPHFITLICICELLQLFLSFAFILSFSWMLPILRHSCNVVSALDFFESFLKRQFIGAGSTWRYRLRLIRLIAFLLMYPLWLYLYDLFEFLILYFDSVFFWDFLLSFVLLGSSYWLLRQGFCMMIRFDELQQLFYGSLWGFLEVKMRRKLFEIAFYHVIKIGRFKRNE